MWTGVMRLTTRLIGTRESRRDACMAVRGKPSRMNEAEGEVDTAGAGEDTGSQFLDFSSARMRWRIVSSGTRLPDLMAP